MHALNKALNTEYLTQPVNWKQIDCTHSANHIPSHRGWQSHCHRQQMPDIILRFFYTEKTHWFSDNNPNRFIPFYMCTLSLAQRTNEIRLWQQIGVVLHLTHTQITITITYKIGQRSLIYKCKYTHKVAPYLRLTLMVKFYLHQNMLHSLNTHRRFFLLLVFIYFSSQFQGEHIFSSLCCWFSLNETITRQTERYRGKRISERKSKHAPKWQEVSFYCQTVVIKMKYELQSEICGGHLYEKYVWKIELKLSK